MTENDIGTIIVECAIAVHCELGPGVPISLRLSVSAGEIQNSKWTFTHSSHKMAILEV